MACVARLTQNLASNSTQAQESFHILVYSESAICGSVERSSHAARLPWGTAGSHQNEGAGLAIVSEAGPHQHMHEMAAVQRILARGKSTLPMLVPQLS